MAITLKIAHGNELRRLTVNSSSTPTFSHVVSQIRKLFPFLDERLPVPLKYADDEGDQVTLATEADWVEAVKFASEGGRNLIRITLGTQPSGLSSTPSSSSLLLETPIPAPQQQQEETKEIPAPAPQQDEVMETSEEPQAPAPFELLSSMEIPTYPEVPPISSSFSSSSPSSSSSALPPFTPFATPFGNYPTAPSSEPSNPGKPRHEGVTCDGCSGPIFGIRYKCAECYDFDLCEECEAKGDHPAHHVTLKIRVPTRVEIWHPYAFRRGPPMCGRYGNEEQQQQQQHRPHHQRHGRCGRWGNAQQAACPTAPESQPERPQEKQEPVAPETPSEFVSELQLLEEMGFFDRETNYRLLKEKKGRIEEVISKLTQLSF